MSELAPDDARWLSAAAALGARARPLSRPNPAVGAIIVKNSIVIGRGWTAPGGRPHAEAVAFEQAGDAAAGATLYVTLEPCAHHSGRGPACADLAARTGLARVVVGCTDPDPRTAGKGIAALREAGIDAQAWDFPAARESLSGYLLSKAASRPEVTLKLALSLDGCIALADGESRWITGEIARAHCHAMRAQSDAILVGGGTLRADEPRLDVRLPGLAGRNPQRWVLTGGQAPEGWQTLSDPQAISAMDGVQYLFVEGGAQTAASFLAADLVDKLLIYRAPIMIGAGVPAIAELGVESLAETHGRWRLDDRRALGSDTLEVYSRTGGEN